MRELHVITDLQFGSCGKGLFAGYLARKVEPDTIVTAWSPNAGHTYIGEDGVKMTNIMIPNGIVAPSVRRVLIGPGSLINPEIMRDEIDRYAHLLKSVDILIHESAMVITEDHRKAEEAYGFRIGSTMKGMGEAAAQKLKRIDPECLARDKFSALGYYDLNRRVVTAEEYNSAVHFSKRVLIEGAQGFSLSLNQGFYPFVTHRECTTHQVLADCSIPFSESRRTEIYGACRTHPIRVANRYNSKGVQVGTSGPCYPDQKEIDWNDIVDMQGNRLMPELTTVTKLPRRVFTFSHTQVQEAVHMNGVTSIFLNFCNYHRTRGQAMQLAKEIQQLNPAVVSWLGWGPNVNDVQEIGDADRT